MSQSSDRRIALWLALILFGVYLLTYSGQIFSGDGMSMFSVAESFVKRGELNTDQLWTLFKSRNEIAADGESYAKYGFGTSLFIAPLYALALVLPGIGLVQTSILGSALAIAFASALLFLAARRLNFATNVSIVVALLFGLATPAWVYARELWSEPYGLATLFAAFYFLLCYRDKRHDRDVLFAGIAFALAVATRLTNVALAPVFVWYGFTDSETVTWLRSRAFTRLSSSTQPAKASSPVPVFILFVVPIVISLLITAGYDWTRFGNPLATGYRADETFDNPILLGLYGLLFSPGKGLFIYVPFLAVLPFSFAIFFRRAKRESILIAILFTFYVLLFSLWYYWWGGTSWGPRFLTPTLPFLLLAIAPAVELALQPGNRGRKIFATVFFALCALSFAIEILGVSLPALSYRVRMVRISSNAEMDAVFLPWLSPLIGYFNLLKPSALNFAWVRVFDGNVMIDWMMIVLISLFILGCVWKMTGDGGRRTAVIGLVFGIVLSFLALYRASDDPHFAMGTGYPALLQTLQREAKSNDVMILNDDARTPMFLNANRASPRWYGLSRDPKQFDGVTRGLLERLTRQYTRVWFAFDAANATLADPTREWLDLACQVMAEHDFDDGVHLILYRPR
ncbi:MAG: hypothetical protein HZB51_28510 [Chloroflexi bacterium]|nr:hypothetical protein [Chloroflexota bacterium]